MGVLLALFSAFAFAFRLFIGKWMINKRSDPIFISFAFQIVVAFLYIPLLFLETPIIPTDISIWLLWLINMIIYFIFTLSNYYMNIHMDISISSILGQTKTIITFLGALLIFNETASLNKFIGVILILLGNILLLLKKKRDNRVSNKGLLFLMINTITISLTSFFDATLVNHFSVNVYGMISYLIPGLFTIPLLLRRFNVTEIKGLFTSNFKSIFIMSFTAPLSYSALLYAYTISDKSVIFPLGNISTLVMVFLGVIFLKERNMLFRKILAAFIVISGAVLLSI